MTDVPETFRAWVTQDWKINSARRDSCVIMAWFRLCQWSLAHWGPLGPVMYKIYYVFCSTVLALELPPDAEIGPALWMPHPHNIHVHPKTRIGRNCMIRQGVTLGNSASMDGVDTECPVIGDYVELGTGCVVVGGAHVGDNARIGANALVATDVPSGALALGNPARILKNASPA